MFKDVIGLSYHRHSFMHSHASRYECEPLAHDVALRCSQDCSTRMEFVLSRLSRASLKEQSATSFVHALLVPVVTSLTALEQNTYDEQGGSIVCQIVSFYLTLHACAVKCYYSIRRHC